MTSTTTARVPTTPASTTTTALVSGGTGARGTRVVHALAAWPGGTTVRMLTRIPASARARALA
ncbi:hypothetical protein FCI23_38955 [Actinacidiphila oryziradicis]|uniref:NmrA family transcriptional regulator n=1 Tax=Actinacidiphila oryziradicis TaxID=2571141 RepID=A0A4U0SP33_9ACTN|nr:hypothetical protein FCI23_38955 [Actinacidiphila oryziradicis]